VRDRIPTLSDVKELVNNGLFIEAQARELFDGWLDGRLKKLEGRQTFWGIVTVLGALSGGILGKLFP
jgi:hypothetical protein